MAQATCGLQGRFCLSSAGRRARGGGTTSRLPRAAPELGRAQRREFLRTPPLGLALSSFSSAHSQPLSHVLPGRPPHRRAHLGLRCVRIRAGAASRCAHTCCAAGSNLQALLDAAGSSSLPDARITQVLSNRKAAYGLERAKNAGVPGAVLSLSPWLKAHPGSSRDDYDGLLAQAVLAGGEGKSADVLAAAREGAAASTSTPAPSALPDLVVLAGFMHIVSSAFLAPLRRANVPVINLHPALPAQFDGVDAIGRAWRAFQDGTLLDGKTGVMVHEVIEEVDRGAPIVVRDVPCRQGESLEGLETRIHAVEHEIIVEAAREMLQRKQR